MRIYTKIPRKKKKALKNRYRKYWNGFKICICSAKKENGILTWEDAYLSPKRGGKYTSGRTRAAKFKTNDTENRNQ